MMGNSMRSNHVMSQFDPMGNGRNNQMMAQCDPMMGHSMRSNQMMSQCDPMSNVRSNQMMTSSQMMPQCEPTGNLRCNQMMAQYEPMVGNPIRSNQLMSQCEPMGNLRSNQMMAQWEPMMGSQMQGSQMMCDPVRNNQPGDWMMHRDSSPQRPVVSSPFTSSALQRLESQTAAPTNSKYTYGPVTVVPQEN
jgi:hypothetical protein